MKKIGLISLALVLALASLGVGYAMWSDTVYIEQTVETGTVSIGFSKISTDEPFGEFEDKDVGSIDGWLTGTIKGTVDYAGVPTDVYEKAEVLMENAYPCYQTAVFIDVANVGTIPVYISSMDISMVEVDGSGIVIDTLTWVWHVIGVSGHFENGAGEDILNMDIVNLLGDQIHPGGKNTVQFDLHVKQPAKQSATYIITISVTGIQWNKYTP